MEDVLVMAGRARKSSDCEETKGEERTEKKTAFQRVIFVSSSIGKVRVRTLTRFI